MTTTGGLAQHERLDMIRSHLQTDGSVRIKGLARELSVSEMTIRRDLDELEAQGTARRVRGGAVAVGPEAFAERHLQRGREKARIAEKLVATIPPSGTVAFDASTTVHRIAASLSLARDLVVVTNGLDAFHVLNNNLGVAPTLTGGSLERRTGSLVGPVARRTAESFIFDLFICSAAGVDPVLGSSEASIEEAEVKRAMARSSNRIVLAVDASKLGAMGQARVFRLDEIHLLVTDLHPSDARLDPYRDHVKLL